MDAFGQFLALGGEQLQAFLRVACGLVVVREQGVHERGADDDAVRVGADLGALFGGGHADAHAHVLGTGLTGTFHEEFGRGVDGGAFAGDAHAGGRIHEAARVAGHGFEALGGRVRGDQEDAVESVAVGGFDPLPRLVRDKVRGDETGAAGVLEVAGETLDAVVVHEVPVAHDERHAAGVGHGFDGLEHALDGLAVVQGDGGGSLDDRAVHDRVGVRQADFHGVDAVLDHRPEGVKRDVRVREAVGQVADEGGLVLGLELGEHSARLAGLVADAQRLAGRRGCFVGHNQKSPLLVQATVLPWAPVTSSAAAWSSVR